MSINAFAYAVYTMPYGEFRNASVIVGDGEFIIRDIIHKADSIYFTARGERYYFTVSVIGDGAYIKMVDFID